MPFSLLISLYKATCNSLEACRIFSFSLLFLTFMLMCPGLGVFCLFCQTLFDPFNLKIHHLWFQKKILNYFFGDCLSPFFLASYYLIPGTLALKFLSFLILCFFRGDFCAFLNLFSVVLLRFLEKVELNAYAQLAVFTWKVINFEI